MRIGILQCKKNLINLKELRYLVPRRNDHSVMGTKWVYRNRLDESGVIIRKIKIDL